MLEGVNSIYVDYLDYDEVAHHAGLARAESLASLSGIDRVIGILNKAKDYAPRPYEIILVSDHGQSQGRTFKQLHKGKVLADFVSEFMGTNIKVLSETKPIEEQSAARTLLSHQSTTSSAARAASKTFEKNASDKQNLDESQLVITGSGNLGNIWIKPYKNRATFEEINEDFPNLINGLINTDGIGMLLVMSKNGPVCISKKGSIELISGNITKTSPLSKFRKIDKDSLLKLSTMDTAPDIAVISSYDEETGEVFAFEELVGNHGGLGGWQTEAILLHPEKLKVPEKYISDDGISGAETIHKIFKSWLKDSGHK